VSTFVRARTILGRWGLLVLLAASICVLALLGPCRPVREWTYRPEVIAEGPWGSDRGCFGRVEGYDGLARGPASFAPRPGGGVVVADTYNNRVVLYAADGNERAEVSVGARIADIGCDANDTVYVLVPPQRAVLRLSPLEGAQETIDVPLPSWFGGDDLYVAEGMSVAPDGSLMVHDHLFGADQYSTRLVRYLADEGRWQIVIERGMDDAADSATATAGALALGFAVWEDGSFARCAGSTDGFRVEIRSGDGEVVLDWQVSGGERPEYVGLIGVDGRRNVYVVKVFSRSRIVAERYTRTGARVGEWEVPPPAAGYAVAVPGRVSTGGDVYWAVADSQGYRVMRWRAAARWGAGCRR